MLEYYAIIFIGAMFAGLSNRRSVILNFYITFFSIFFIAFIGLRHEIGADWFNYLDYYQLSNEGYWIDSLIIGDPGYVLLNRLSNELGGGIYLVNTISATILVYAITKFAKIFSLPGLVLFLSIPNILIIVGMGYTRQSIAVGFELIALLFALDSRYKWAFFYISVAALFHKSAIILFPIFIIGFKILGIGAISLFVLVLSSLYIILEAQFSQLFNIYVEEQLGSSGAFIRTLFNGIPAFLFFLERKFTGDVNYKFWSLLSSISLVLLLLVGLYPVAVDRIVIYLFPIQIYVWVNYIRFISCNVRQLFYFCLIGIYSLSIVVWLNFGIHSEMWVPYRFYLLP